MKLTLNLASRSYVNERALKWGYLLFALLILLILLFQLRISLHTWQLNLDYRTDIEAIEKQLRGKIPAHFTAEQISAQKQSLGRAKELLREDAFRWTVLFDRMEGLLPRDVSIRSFNPNYSDGTLVLTGVCKKLPDLQKLLDNLYASSFKQVFLQNQSQIETLGYDEINRTALQFSIRLEGVF